MTLIPIGTTPVIDTDLVTTHALSILAQKLPDFVADMETIKAQATRHGLYPDGTLLIEGGNSSHKLWDLIVRKQLVASGGIWEPVGFAALEPFPHKLCALWYTTDYREALGELSFTVVFPGMRTCPTKDYQLENLQISVLFKRKPTPEVRQRFATCLGDLFHSVSSQGMFGDGPIKPMSRELEFRGPLAQFRVDASRSGQDTLNWLLLSVLNFGYEVSAVQQFFFDHERQIESFTGRISGKVEYISIPSLLAV